MTGHQELCIPDVIPGADGSRIMWTDGPTRYMATDDDCVFGPVLYFATPQLARAAALEAQRLVGQFMERI